jgi:fucose permease
MIMGVSGGAFIPPLTGIVSDKFGQMAGLSVLLICLAYLSVLSFQSK